MEPWQFYLQQLQRRTERIPPGAFGRAELFAEAAHDAYQATSDHLTRLGWNEEEALTVTRMFGQAVKEWLARGQDNWAGLSADLDRRYAEWTSNGRDEV